MGRERAAALAGLVLLIAVLGGPDPVRADLFGDVLARLESQGPVVVRFEEERHVSFLDRPLRSAGTLSFTPPDVLIKQTLTPKTSLARVDGDELLIVDDDEERRVPLDAEPSIRATIDLLRALLAGDRETLERRFEVAAETGAGGWSAVLSPREPTVAKRLARIEVSGREARVERIEFHETGGDRSVLTLSEPDA